MCPMFKISTYNTHIHSRVQYDCVLERGSEPAAGPLPDLHRYRAADHLLRDDAGLHRERRVALQTHRQRRGAAHSHHPPAIW